MGSVRMLLSPSCPRSSDLVSATPGEPPYRQASRGGEFKTPSLTTLLPVCLLLGAPGGAWGGGGGGLGLTHCRIPQCLAHT